MTRRDQEPTTTEDRIPIRGPRDPRFDRCASAVIGVYLVLIVILAIALLLVPWLRMSRCLVGSL